jgi:hypothetical protein
VRTSHHVSLLCGCGVVSSLVRAVYLSIFSLLLYFFSLFFSSSVL